TRRIFRNLSRRDSSLSFGAIVTGGSCLLPATSHHLRIVYATAKIPRGDALTVTPHGVAECMRQAQVARRMIGLGLKRQGDDVIERGRQWVAPRVGAANLDPAQLARPPVPLVDRQAHRIGYGELAQTRRLRMHCGAPSHPAARIGAVRIWGLVDEACAAHATHACEPALAIGRDDNDARTCRTAGRMHNLLGPRPPVVVTLSAPLRAERGSPRRRGVVCAAELAHLRVLLAAIHPAMPRGVVT